MTLSQKVFWVCTLFISGVFTAQIGVTFLVACIGTIFFVLLSIIFWASGWGARALFFVPLIAVAFLGFSYSYWRDARLVDLQSRISFSSHARVEGIISAPPRVSDKSIRIIVKQKDRSLIAAYVEPYRLYAYDDHVILEGAVNPLDATSSFLSLSGVGGVMQFASVVSHSPPSSPGFLRGLFMIRQRFSMALSRVLPQEEAALASGLVLGKDSALFSSSFKEAMRNSGTTHLVALSGYNITVVISTLWSFIGLFFRRRITSALVVCGVVLFVVMTGAESSVVRAALMGVLSIGAFMWSRVYSFPQTVALAGFCMVLYNPLVLTRDVGFILSFLALFGISVLAPLLSAVFLRGCSFGRTIFHIFFQTLSAQLAVFPVLAITFGSISFAGIVSNVFILPIIPLTMFFSLCAGVSYFITSLFSTLCGALAFFPLKYITTLIYFFGSFPVVSVSWSWIALLFYYGVLGSFVAFFYYYSKRRFYAL